MFLFFDYLYIKVFNFYSAAHDKIPKFRGALVVSLMQFFNIFIIIEIITLFTHHKLAIKTVSGIISMLVVFSLNYFRYKRNHNKIINKWGKEKSKNKMVGNIITIAYIALSAIFCIGLAIYIGSKKW